MLATHPTETEQTDMAIDYVVNYLCEPKDQLTTQGILARLKGQAQAQRIIQLYRDANDERPIDQMGFELTRNTADGDEETETVLVSEILEASRQLEPLAHHCQGCPANLKEAPYGCFNNISYPLSDHAERWLLLQLPIPEEAPLVWTLISQHLRDLNRHSDQVQQVRESGTYFESERNPRRRLGEIAVSGNNLFYLLFMQGHMTPSRAAVTLLMFGAIPRNIDAGDILKLTPAPADADERFPFVLGPEREDDRTVFELKAFFAALYTGWRLGVDVLLDV